MLALIRTRIRVVIVAGLTAVFAQPAITAQSPGTPVVANIPFTFQIGSAQLAPGTYQLEIEGNNLLWVKGDSGSAVMQVMRESANRPSTDSVIVFHHYGNQYFLREVRTTGSADMLWSGETKDERRAKLELAAANPNSGPRADSKVEVALLAPPR